MIGRLIPSFFLLQLLPELDLLGSLDVEHECDADREEVEGEVADHLDHQRREKHLCEKSDDEQNHVGGGQGCIRPDKHFQILLHLDDLGLVVVRAEEALGQQCVQVGQCEGSKTEKDSLEGDLAQMDSLHPVFDFFSVQLARVFGVIVNLKGINSDADDNDCGDEAPSEAVETMLLVDSFHLTLWVLTLLVVKDHVAQVDALGDGKDD